MVGGESLIIVNILVRSIVRTLTDVNWLCLDRLLALVIGLRPGDPLIDGSRKISVFEFSFVILQKQVVFVNFIFYLGKCADGSCDALALWVNITHLVGVNVVLFKGVD